MKWFTPASLGGARAQSETHTPLSNSSFENIEAKAVFFAMWATKRGRFCQAEDDFQQTRPDSPALADFQVVEAKQGRAKGGTQKMTSNLPCPQSQIRTKRWAKLLNQFMFSEVREIKYTWNY